MLFRIFKRKINNREGLFNGHFIEVKAFYTQEFDALACVSFIGELEASEAFAFISGNMGAAIQRTYQHSYFDYKEKKMFFNNTIFVLNDKRMIELGSNYCQVLHTPNQYKWANNLIENLSRFRIVNNEPAIGFVRQTVAN